MTQRTTLRALLCAATALTGAAFALPAFAQDAVAPAEDASGVSSVDEVIITARKKAESLQDTPVTVTVFSGEKLQEEGITDFQKLADATPGVTIDAFPRAARVPSSAASAVPTRAPAATPARSPSSMVSTSGVAPCWPSIPSTWNGSRC